MITSTTRRAREVSASPKATLLAVGQRWKECDVRSNRVVTIVAINAELNRVAIRPIEPVSGRANGRLNWASIARFNGKSGGYEFVREAAC